MSTRSNYDPDLEYYANRIFVVNFCISSTLFPLVVYLIITQSKMMRAYRWYLLNAIVSAQVSELFLQMAASVFLVSCLKVAM
jgi:hypothetical protein